MIGWVTGDPLSDHDQEQAGYIRFANGVEAFRHTNSNAKNGIEVLCTKGSFYTDFMYLKMWKLRDPDDRPHWHNGLVEMEGLFKEESQHERSGTHGEDGWRWAGNRNLASVQSIIDAIENGVDPIGSGENSLKCLEIAIALRESHRRGRTPVRLPLEDRSLRIVPADVTVAQQEGDGADRGLPGVHRELEAGIKPEASSPVVGATLVVALSLCWTQFSFLRRCVAGPLRHSLAATFFHESRSVTVLLNTNSPGFESASTAK